MQQSQPHFTASDRRATAVPAAAVTSKTRTSAMLPPAPATVAPVTLPCVPGPGPARPRRGRPAPPRPIVPIDHASLRAVLPRWPEPTAEDRRDTLRLSLLDLLADARAAFNAGRDDSAELLARITSISRAAIPA